MTEKNIEIATLGGGCFWCLDAIFREIRGVISVVCGYAGGHIQNPTYEQVCAKTTGHAEVVQVHFDTSIINYEDILNIFWHIHDPTTLNRQGDDIGPQYRSIIFYHNDTQKISALNSLAREQEIGTWPNPFVTEIKPLETFFQAEEYHQNYFARNSSQSYCTYVVGPKLQKFRKNFADKL